ncbi:response regulator transcription factor [Collinsella sp. An2]|uniref:response regulator transcription factor n=1 Tax=Collinsella sp. An2 TaxID=1965585 RepID=UPI000B3869BA|nr:response regulator transcription factor [Collinsella sp. An2]OUP09472.1 transcriptional regulator [Collinsella sp. An2]
MPETETCILFMARTTRFHEFVRSLTTSMGVEVSLATPDSPTAAHDFSLLLLDADGVRNDRIEQISKWLDDRGGIPMLLIVDDEALGGLRMPPHARCDFICSTASTTELEVRVRRLLGDEESFAVDDVLRIDNLVINLATYQVYLDDEPVDLTLMEYSLLSFLATHPNRAYSREVLLHRVWGFEYCGGTRTVDVHIRRIRSKVGPQIAAHITTVRGVGYLFKE